MANSAITILSWRHLLSVLFSRMWKKVQFAGLLTGHPKGPNVASWTGKQKLCRLESLCGCSRSAVSSFIFNQLYATCLTCHLYTGALAKLCHTPAPGPADAALRQMLAMCSLASSPPLEPPPKLSPFLAFSFAVLCLPNIGHHYAYWWCVSVWGGCWIATVTWIHQKGCRRPLDTVD